MSIVSLEYKNPFIPIKNVNTEEIIIHNKNFSKASSVGILIAFIKLQYSKNVISKLDNEIDNKNIFEIYLHEFIIPVE